jgi:hypothetical protein
LGRQFIDIFLAGDECEGKVKLAGGLKTAMDGDFAEAASSGMKLSGAFRTRISC